MNFGCACRMRSSSHPEERSPVVVILRSAATRICSWPPQVRTRAMAEHSRKPGSPRTTPGGDGLTRRRRRACRVPAVDLPCSCGGDDPGPAASVTAFRRADPSRCAPEDEQDSARAPEDDYSYSASEFTTASSSLSRMTLCGGPRIDRERERNIRPARWSVVLPAPAGDDDERTPVHDIE